MTHDEHPDGSDVSAQQHDENPEDHTGDLIAPTVDPADDGDDAPADEPEQV